MWNFKSAHRHVDHLAVGVFILFFIMLSTAVLARQGDRPGRFSYYALVLSWSPSYCANRKSGRFEQQCDSTRPYAFVLHGVWPQYDRGWPENCRVKRRWIPRNIVNSMLDIMPSRKLVIHEWKKHGTCSGLGPSEYYALSRQLFEKIKIPARYLSPNKPIVTSPQGIERDFLKTNPKLSADMISIACGRRNRLRDVRICFNRRLEPIACGVNENQRKLCRRETIVMPPVRNTSLPGKENRTGTSAERRL